MDRLPVELISIIGGGLQQWNALDEPFSYLTGTTKDRVDGWLVHTINSREDICNFRLVSSKCYNSSLSTFGELLGNRVFRITRVGLEDMQAISSMASLRPYIRQLTLGTARFDHISDNVVMQEVMGALPEPDKTRLYTTYSDAYQWQKIHRGSICTEEVAQVLRRLSNLRNLRILLSDYADMSNHLGGWLGPGDEAIVAKAFSESVSSLFVNEYIYKFRYPDHMTWLAPVFDAMKSTETVIQDLRVGCGHAPPPNDFSRMLNKTGMVSSLRHLRLDMDPTSLRESGSFYYSCYDDTFQGFTSLTHLTLSMVQVAGLERYAEATENLLNLLKPLNRLQHLTIRGIWSYSEDELVDFISSRSDSLTLLAFKGAVMDVGDWSSTISRLVQLQPRTLRYLEVSAMSTINSTNRIVPVFMDSFDWQEFVSTVKKPIEGQAMCSVYLTSGTDEYLFEPFVR